MDHPELRVPWATLSKNLLKEQLSLEMKPEWRPTKNIPQTATIKARTEKSDISDRVFGGKLQQHYYMEDDNNGRRYLRLPPILQHIFGFLTSDRSLRSVGLFRVLASTEQTTALIDQFNERQKTMQKFDDIVFDNTTDPNVVGNLLKEYLRRLETPLLHPVESFMEIAKIENLETRMHEFMKAFKKLDHNIFRRVFRELIEVMNEFLYHSHLNKLNSRVLSLTLGPFILQQQKEQTINAKNPNAQLYYNLFGMCMENFDKLFMEGYDFTKLEGGAVEDNDKKSGNTLGAFLEKIKEKGASASSSNFLNGDKKEEEGSNTSNASSSNTTESKPPAAGSGDDYQDIQDRWREYVESWKQKYKLEKDEHDKLKAILEEITKDWLKDKRQLEDEMQKLKMQISSSEISEDDELLQLEEEKKKALREIERERERYKLEKESHDDRMKKVKRRQLLALKKMGIETTDEAASKLSPEFFKLKRQQGGATGVTAEEEEDAIKSSSSVPRTTVGGSKIQVNDRFKKKK